MAYGLISLGPHGKDAERTNLTVSRLRSALPSLHLLPTVNGHNHTDLVEKLLESGLAFHGLSASSRRAGVLACALSHYFALTFQLERRLPWLLTMEEDGVTHGALPPAPCTFVPLTRVHC